MAASSRPGPERLDHGRYPFSVTVPTRFQDLDPLGHINNVAMAALFETGRVLFNRTQMAERRNRPAGHRWLVARVEINYLRETYFPDPVEVATGIGPVGNSSWTIWSAAFQRGECVGLCDATVVYIGEAGPQPLTDTMREELAAWAVRTGD